MRAHRLGRGVEPLEPARRIARGQRLARQLPDAILRIAGRRRGRPASSFGSHAASLGQDCASQQRKPTIRRAVTGPPGGGFWQIMEAYGGS